MNEHLLQAAFVVMVLALLIYLFIMEKRRPYKFHYAVRWCASAVALLSLVGWLLPLSYSSKIDSMGSEVCYVFTKGTPKDTIEKRKREQYVVTTDSAISRTYRIIWAKNWSDFAQENKGRQLVVYGYGLSENSLRCVKDNSISYYKPSMPEGFVFAYWQQYAGESEDILLWLQYHNPRNQAVKIALKDASVLVDSATVSPDTSSSLLLRSKPKGVGNAVLDLIAIAGRDTLFREKVPVHIAVPSLPNVLLLSSTPSFQYKFLGTWFQELHYPLASRSRISKDRFSTLYTSGHPFNQLDNLEKLDFSKLDLLIADEAELSQLSGRETKAIEKAIKEGLGLLILGNSAATPSFFGHLFDWKRDEQANERAVQLVAANGERFSPLAFDEEAALGYSEDQKGLLYDGNRIVAATRPYGLGHITATTAQNTHQWRLKGDNGSYTKLWSTLINSALRKQETDGGTVYGATFPSVFQWTYMAVIGPSVHSFVDYYPPISDNWIVRRHSYTFWPINGGWHTDRDFHYYVYGNADWQAAKDYARMQDNQKFVQQMFSLGSTAFSGTAYDQIPLPKWPFFVLFLASIAFLWYTGRDFI